MRRRLLAGGLLVGLTLTGALPAHSNDGLAVEVAEDGRGAYRVTGAFTVAADHGAVWQVLTDYDRLGQFIPSMKSSLVKREGAHVALVSQATTTRVMAISATTRVLLRLQEAPPHSIRFTDVSGRDFERYQGTWTIEASGEGTRVGYEAAAKPRFVPPLVGKSIMEGTVRGLLQDLRREVLRRRAG